MYRELRTRASTGPEFELPVSTLEPDWYGGMRAGDSGAPATNTLYPIVCSVPFREASGTVLKGREHSGGDRELSTPGWRGAPCRSS